MTRRFKALVILVVVVLTVATVGYVASAASTSTNLAGGDSLTVNCTGGGRLNQRRLSRTSILDTCAPGVTRTTRTTATTRATTTTSAPGGGGGGGGGGVGSCTPAASGSLGPFAYSGIVNSNGFNTYVGNNMWGANAGTTQTVCGDSPGKWTLTANAGPARYTGVQTYPDIQQLMNNWTGAGWGACGPSNCTDTPVASLKSLTSTFDISNPSPSQGVWEAAYDIWTSSGELMIWTSYSDVRLADNGATITNPDVVVGGLHYTDMNYRGGLPQMVLHGNPSSGTVDILAVLKYWQSQGKLAANATIGQLDYGWEICSTVGTQNFAVNGYTLSGS
jgi:hypothetical protein